MLLAEIILMEKFFNNKKVKNGLYKELTISTALQEKRTARTEEGQQNFKNNNVQRKRKQISDISLVTLG